MHQVCCPHQQSCELGSGALWRGAGKSGCCQAAAAPGPHQRRLHHNSEFDGCALLGSHSREARLFQQAEARQAKRGGRGQGAQLLRLSLHSCTLCVFVCVLVCLCVCTRVLCVYAYVCAHRVLVLHMVMWLVFLKCWLDMGGDMV